MTETNVGTWHFFRRTAETDLWCAVPAHKGLPAFLLSGDWHYAGHRLGQDAIPPGFNPLAAAVGERFNGFYVFQILAEPRGLTRLAA